MTTATLEQPYVISTIAGGAPQATPVPAISASIGRPHGVATDAAGCVYFANLDCVFKLDQHGVLTRIAGNSRVGYSGDGGPATDAQLSYAFSLALDSGGNLYIAGSVDNRVRKVLPSGIIITVAGNGMGGYSGDGGPATMAKLFTPRGVAVDSAGNLFIADSNNGRIRRGASLPQWPAVARAP